MIATDPRDDQTSTTDPGSPSAPQRCDRTAAVTRSLLGYGVLAGPVYVVTSLVQALTRDGFDLARHDWSLLANGPWGWIQCTNLVLAGLMCVAAAVGLRRALRGGPGGTWGPRLLGLYGIGIGIAGVLVADPMNGFPLGTPDGPPAAVSWHGVGHLVTGSVGFLSLIGACFVLARAFGRTGRTGWAWYSRGTGVFFLASFVGIASGSGSPVVVLGFCAGVIAAFAWIAAVSIHLYRRTPIFPAA